jgi:hypothetical protein
MMTTFPSGRKPYRRTARKNTGPTAAEIKAYWSGADNKPPLTPADRQRMDVVRIYRYDPSQPDGIGNLLRTEYAYETPLSFRKTGGDMAERSAAAVESGD